MTKGGQGFSRECAPVYSYDRYGYFIKEYSSVRKAAEELNLTTSAIWSALSSHNLGNGM